MEYQPQNGEDSIINARAERIIVIPLSLKLLISVKGRENTFALCLPPNDDVTNLGKEFRDSKKPE